MRSTIITTLPIRSSEISTVETRWSYNRLNRIAFRRGPFVKCGVHRLSPVHLCFWSLSFSFAYFTYELSTYKLSKYTNVERYLCGARIHCWMHQFTKTILHSEIEYDSISIVFFSCLVLFSFCIFCVFYMMSWCNEHWTETMATNKIVFESERI